MNVKSRISTTIMPKESKCTLRFLTLFLLCVFISDSVGGFAQSLDLQGIGYPAVPIQQSGTSYIDPPFYSDASFISSTPIFDDVVIPFDGNYSSIPTPIPQGPQFSTIIPSFSQNDVITANNGGSYTILGDVTGAIPFGSSDYDNIPFLNEGTKPRSRQLPELKIPQNDQEFNEQVQTLLNRFSAPNLSIKQSTPARLLRYSLIGGANQTFLAPADIENASNPSSTVPNKIQPMYALGALCWNVPCSNRQLLRVVNDLPAPEVGFGFQSQRGELLACLAFAKIDRKYELRVEGKTFTVQDLVEWEKYSCSSYANLSLVAIGLAHYSQNPDEIWVNQIGEKWSLQKLLEEEAHRKIDWNTSESTDKLLAFTYLLARLKQSSKVSSPELAPILQKTESFLIAMKKMTWDNFGESALSESLFFNTEIKLTTPYMKLYVNGKLLRWLTIVSSQEELESPPMKQALFELCALTNQLFNSEPNLELLSSLDEESLSVALQTLNLYFHNRASNVVKK